MSQILKLADGNQVKNKKQLDLDQIAANRKKIQDAYDAGRLTDDQKAQLDMISQNAQSYLAADPMHNRNARKFQLELTNRMAEIVDGKSGYTPYSTEVADKNILGRYSDQEMGLIANELVRLTLQGKGQGSASVVSSTPSQSASTENMHHQYDWLGGTNLDLLPASATIKDKVKAVIAGLNKGINDAKTAHADGKRVHGFDPTKFESAKAKLDGLTITDEDDDDAAFRKLIDIVQDGTFAIPADTFKSLFSKYYTVQEKTATESPTSITETSLQNNTSTTFQSPEQVQLSAVEHAQQNDVVEEILNIQKDLTGFLQASLQSKNVLKDNITVADFSELGELDWDSVPNISYAEGKIPGWSGPLFFKEEHETNRIKNKTVPSVNPVKYVEELLQDITEYDPTNPYFHIAYRNIGWEKGGKYQKDLVNRFLSIIKYSNFNPNLDQSKQILAIINKPEYKKALYQILSKIKKVPQSKEGGKIEKPIHKINTESFSKLSVLKQYKKK